jgi:ABC-type antimicrobial peptide transport system permease subunit
MRLSDTLLTATQNLGRRKVRTVLTSIGVFVGIITIVTMVSLGIGIQRQITDTISALGLDTVFASPIVTRPPGGTNPNARLRPEAPLNAAAVERIKTVPGVTSVEVVLSLPSAPEITLTIDGKTFPITVRDYNPQERIFAGQETMLAGQALDFMEDTRGVVLGERLLKGASFAPEQYAGLVGKPATITVTAPRGDKQTFSTTVKGIVQTLNRAGADLGNADKLDIKRWWYNDPAILESEGYSAVVVHTASLNDATRVSKQVGEMGFRAATLQTFLDQVNRIFAILQIMLSSVGLLALLVASIGIANTMIMSIYERTREIGTLKALGSSNGDVLRIFMLEAGLIGLFGGIVGIVLGWLLGLGLNEVIDGYLRNEQIPLEGPFFVVTWELVAGALVFAAFVGIIAGLYPAFRAARLDPLAALRHE